MDWVSCSDLEISTTFDAQRIVESPFSMLLQLLLWHSILDHDFYSRKSDINA